MRLFQNATAIVFVAALVQPAWAQDTADNGMREARPGVMDLRGHGEVMAVPDTAYINSGVVTEAETARDALTANTEAMTQLIDVLKQAGIDDRDIQTSNFTVQPQYVYPDERDSDGYTRPPKISGYRVSNAVTVRIRQLDSLGAVLDQAVSVGANTVNSVSFAVGDPDSLYDDARKRAVADAIAKAELYAEAAGVTLGRIRSISENGPVPLPKAMDAQVMRMEAVPAAVPVQAGEISYSVDVAIRWELQP